MSFLSTSDLISLYSVMVWMILCSMCVEVIVDQEELISVVTRTHSTFWILWVTYMCGAELVPTFVFVLHS